MSIASVFLEKWFGSTKDRYNSSSDVFINPTKKELKSAAATMWEDWPIRALIYNNDVYVWTAGVAMLHGIMIDYLMYELGLKKEDRQHFIGIYLDIDEEGRVTGVKDAGKHPNFNEIISKCRYLSRLVVDKVKQGVA